MSEKWGLYDPDGKYIVDSDEETEEAAWKDFAPGFLYYGLFGEEKTISEMKGMGFTVTTGVPSND